MAGVAQVITPDMASGAQVIDGSLKFDDSANQHLERTISASNRRTFTLSAWVKHSTTDSNDRLLGNYTDGNSYSSFYFRDTPDFQISFVERISGTYNIQCHSTRYASDTGWYHIVWAVDTTQSTDTDRVKLYVNGVQETLTGSYSSGAPSGSVTFPSENYETRILAAYDHKVGARSGTDCWDGFMSQYYVIDGQALGPENFGFTDPLTNTWKPKKFIPTKVNDGRTWSSGISNADSSYPGTNLFDGNLGTYTEGTNGGGDVTFSGSITGSTIEFYGNKAGSSTFSVNGVDKTSLVPASVGWFTITGVTNITAFAFNRGAPGNYVDLYAIRVDGVTLLDADTSNFGKNGFYLPFDGNSPIGQDQSGNGND